MPLGRVNMFSHRAFARRAGVRSPNHLKRIIDGDRSLTAGLSTSEDDRKKRPQ
jgi:hypothetical protein